VRPKLYLITVPELEVSSHWRAVHDRLLDEFPEVTDVLATTTKSTVLIVYQGMPDADGWLETVSETILGSRRRTRARQQPTPASRPPAAHNRASQRSERDSLWRRAR
jgi:hypothetical protein